MSTVAALAAQMAAGSGDASIEFSGDAGVLRSRDLSATLNAADEANYASGNASGISMHSGGGSKARKALSVVAMKDKMVSLRAEVLDTLSLLESMIDDTGNRTKAMHRRMNDNHLSELKHVEAFDEGFVHMDLVGFDVPRAMREAALAFDVPFFQAYGLPIRTPNDAVVKKKFIELESKLMVGDEVDKNISEIRRDITKPLFPLGDGSLPELLLSLNNFTMTDVIGNTKKELRSLQEPIDEINAKIAETRKDMDQAMSEQKMDVAEGLDLQCIDLCAKKLELQVRRIKLLCSSEGGGVLASLELVTKNPEVPRLLQEKQAHHATSQSDLRKLDLDHTDKLKENESAIQKYNNMVSDSKRKIRSNHAQQHQTWIQLEQLLESLAELEKQDISLVREHIRITEVEQKRRQEHREYRETYANHRQTLEDMIANTAAGVAFVQQVQQATEKGKEKIVAACIEDQIKELLKVERKAYHLAFQAYGAQAGQSLSRYDKRAAAIEQMTNDLQFMRKHANETGDDQANAYVKRINDLEKQLRKGRKTLDRLKNEYDAKETEFYELERTVKTALDILDDPSDAGAQLVEMLLRYRAESLTRFVNQIGQLTSSNSSFVDEARAKQAQLSMDASVLRDSVKERRATRKATESSNSMMSSPTRPDSRSATSPTALNISNIEVQHE